ncbi:MAG: hypothetical protein Tsb0019_30430 [Roseibium sp.]
MRLTPPSFPVFVISLALFLVAVLPMAGVAVPAIGIAGSHLLIAAWAVLAAGVLFKGI